MFHISAVVLPDSTRRDFYVVDGRFSTTAPEQAVAIPTGGFAVPGLVDAHAHLALNSPAPHTETEDARIRASARAQLEAGVLLVREPGSPSRMTRDLGPAGGFPRVRTAGHFLAGVGRYFPDWPGRWSRATSPPRWPTSWHGAAIEPR